jgi:ribosomal-protein-alanine N-acetyltransferase
MEMSDCEFKIITAAPEHLPQILQIEREVFPDSWSENMMRFYFAEKRAIILTAVQTEEYSDSVAVAKNGSVLGYLMAFAVAGMCDIDNIAVSETHRRKGIAKALFNELENRLDMDMEYFLEVRTGNIPAINLYTQLGFHFVRIRKDYYRKPMEDAVLMKKDSVFKENVCL